MASNTLRLETNVPEVVALQFDEGMAVSSPYSGDQVCYTLTDGRKMYLPPIVASKISAAGIRASQDFAICKREVKDGNRRRIEYEVDLVADMTRRAFERNGTSGVVQAPVKSETATVIQTAAAPKQINSASNELAQFQHTAPRPTAAATPVEGKSVVALLTMAGCGAIDAVLQIEQYAAARGLTDFSFGVENIQKFAACLFIELNRKAGRA